MDINFHYFAVKTLAGEAGFSNDEAQIIAEFSQFVDDYDKDNVLLCDNMPMYMRRDPRLDLYHGNGRVRTVQTGFPGLIDMASLLMPSKQKLVVSPFHFIPQRSSESRTADSYRHARTIEARVGDGSIIGDLMHTAKELYLASSPEYHEGYLVKIGTLLHVFADTYAHNVFSGFKSWANSVKVTDVFDNATGDDVTAKHFVKTEVLLIGEDRQRGVPGIIAVPGGGVPDAWMNDGGFPAEEEIYAALEMTKGDKISKRRIVVDIPIERIPASDDALGFELIPPIGHAQAEHIPDYTHQSFRMELRDREGGDYSNIYTRDNTCEFLIAARRILDFLRECRRNAAISDDEWADLKPRLRSVFIKPYTSKTSFDEHAANWERYFNNYDYSYDKAGIENSFATGGNNFSERFYSFQETVNEIQYKIYGCKPRS